MSSRRFESSYYGPDVGLQSEFLRLMESLASHEFQNGTETLATSATAVITFLHPLETPDYNVMLTGNIGTETFFVTAKLVTGFTLNSTNGTSTATVDWEVRRRG